MQLRTIETKNRILIESAKLFAENGFNACSIRMIGKAAGVNHAVISYHFGNKEELWFAVIQYLYKEMYQLIKVKDDEIKDVREGFRFYISGLVSFFVERPHLLKVIFQESLSDSPRLKKIIPLSLGLKKVTEKYLSSIQKKGYIADISIDHLSTMLSAVITQKIIHPKLYSEDQTKIKFDDKMIKEHTDAIVNLFLIRE